MYLFAYFIRKFGPAFGLYRIRCLKRLFVTNSKKIRDREKVSTGRTDKKSACIGRAFDCKLECKQYDKSHCP